MEKLTFRQTLNSFLFNELRTNRNSVFVGSDTKDITGTLGFDAQIAGERLIELPDSEEANLGVAGGLFNEGFDVFCYMKSSKYVIRALEPLVNYLAKYDALGMKSMGSFTLLVPVGYRPYSSMAECETPEAVVAHYPGLNVIYPSNVNDLLAMMKLSMEEHRVTVAFIDLMLLDKEVSEDDAVLKEGFGAKVVKEGRDVTVITYGSLLRNALKTAGMAEKNDVSVEVIDLRTIRPLDEKTIISSVSKTGRAVVLYKDYRRFSVGSEIAAVIADSEAFDYLEAPVRRVCFSGDLMTYSPESTRKRMPASGDLLQVILDLNSY